MAISGANEVYKKVSPLVEAQFPEHIRENGPRFVAFLEAYYEYLEQTNKAGNAIRTLNDNQDIDRTVSDFVEYFRREFALSIPKSALADKRLIVKHIREFYRSRGSQKSFKFLFHILFGKEVDFYYPGEDILRVSDGRWIKETVITVETNTGNLNLLDGRVITGQTSGALGRVQGILKTINLGVEVFKLTVEKVTGVFQDKEIISDGFGNTVKVRSGLGGLIDQTITHGGAFNVKGDDVSLVGDINGSVATGKVASIKNSTGITLTITKGGTGYRTGISSTFNIDAPGSGITLPVFSVVSLSNTSTAIIFTDLIKSIQNVKLDGGITSGNASLTFATVGANSTTLSANLASANIYSVIGAKLKQGNVVIGSINAISVLSPGNGYTTAPSVTVIDQDVAADVIVGHNGQIRGKDATLSAAIAPGAISGITITSEGTNFSLGEKINITNNRSPVLVITTDNSTPPGIARHVINTIKNGNTSASIVSSVQTLPGRYLGTKGFLSWNNRIQDNDYYQEFSYVLKSTKLVDSYRDVVQNVLHTAGTKMFGSFEIISQPNTAITVASSVPEIIYESNFIPLSLEDGGGFVRIEDPGIRFIQENVDFDGFISHEGADDDGNLISEEHDINFVSYVEQETPGAYIRDSRKEIITSTLDRLSATAVFVASATELAEPTDLSSAVIVKEVNIFESGVTPVDSMTAVYAGPGSILESDVTPVDSMTAVYTGPGSILESGVTPVDIVAPVTVAEGSVLESAQPEDLITAVTVGTVSVLESAQPADLPVKYNLATTTGQSTGYVRVVYGNTQMTTFSTDTVNLFKGVQLQTVIDLDGIPRLVLVTPPDVGINMDRQANGNFGNGSILTSTKVVISQGGGGTGSETYTVTNNGSSNYVIGGNSNPTLNLLRGYTYTFIINASGHPFWIKTALTTGTGNAFNTGVTNNGTDVGTITFVVPNNAPDILYYVCQYHSSMQGQINISNPAMNIFTVATVHSNNFLTLTSDYLPTTANAQLYWSS